MKSNNTVSEVAINLEELKEALTHIIVANKTNQVKGLPPVAANIIGPAGLGKTSVVEQMADVMGYNANNVVVLSLAQLNEIGDLIGIPVEEYRMVGKNKDGGIDTVWVREKAITSYERLGYAITNDSRMTYSEPAWIKGKDGDGILILDDYTRASSQFTQAVMELISRQTYMNWKLPKGWTILLSSNPDDGVYTVSYQDPAQQSRYINFDIKWDAEVWAKWAEKVGIDSRCINFVLITKELVNSNNPKVNPRSISNFFNVISTFHDFEKSLKMIQLIGQGTLGFEASAMFSTFILNKMDRIIDPSKIFNSSIPFEDIENEILDLVKTGVDYRSDIAHMLTLRVTNYLDLAIKPADITPALKKRATELLSSTCLGTDLRFVVTTRLIAGQNGTHWNDILMTDEVYKMVIE